MKSRWLTVGIPMACPRCSAAYPCHFSEQREVTMPLDMPLTINTNIQYNLDKDKFPGLDSGNKELTLMMAPVSVVAPQTNTQCLAQTLVSTPLPSEDMQCSSGYVSEEDDIICLDDQDLDTPGIVSLIDSFRENTEHMDSPAQEPCAKRRQISPAKDCGLPTCGYPPRQHTSTTQTNNIHSSIPNHAQNFCLKSSRHNMPNGQGQPGFAGHPLAAEFAIRSQQQVMPQDCGRFQDSLSHRHHQWNPSQKPSDVFYFSGATNNLPPSGIDVFGQNTQSGLHRGSHHMYSHSGHSGLNRVPQNMFGGLHPQQQPHQPQIHQSHAHNLPVSMQTGFTAPVTQRRFSSSRNWGNSVSNPIYV